MRVVVLAVAALLAVHVADAAEPASLMRARTLYNAADYDGAIAAAALARTQTPGADAAALVEARARLERFRRNADPEDLIAARDALNTIRASALAGRDQVDFLVGLGQSLYLTDFFGAAADLFDTALERSAPLPDHDRMLLLDWWATAVDREAQVAPSDRRSRLAAQITARMEDELRRDPGSAPANYWLAVAARAAGDLDAAWDAAVAAWVRATLGPGTEQLRADIDRLVMQLRPVRLFHRQPVPVRLQPPLKHPVRLALLVRDESDDFLVQPHRRRLGLHVRDKPPLVFAVGEGLDLSGFGRHFDNTRAFGDEAGTKTHGRTSRSAHAPENCNARTFTARKSNN